jgi:glyoxylase-like metal-dependent hydrolase (beta-lactamase superfamily II)
MSSTLRLRWCLPLALLLGCSTTATVTAYEPKLVSPEIVPIELGGLYNVTVVKGARAILVDTGPPGSFDDLAAGLESAGVHPKDLALVVLTHGHSDHAGNARALQKLGVPVLAHEGDHELLVHGDHGDLFATSFEGVFAQPFIGATYPAVTPDVELEGETPMSLSEFGVEAEVMHAGGHTAGSLVVHVANGGVILGDLIRGGWLAGMVDRDAPATHLFHAYPIEEHLPEAEGFAKRVAACPDVKVAFVGHGGPIPAANLRAWAGETKPSDCPW